MEGLFPYFSHPKQSPLINAVTSINGSPYSNLTTNSTKPPTVIHTYTSINSSQPYSCNNSAIVMTRKRATPTPTSQPPRAPNQNNSPLNPNAQSYAHVTTPPSNIQLPPYPPTVQRYQSPPWQHYVDQNPWSFSHIQNPPPQLENIQNHPQLPYPRTQITTYGKGGVTTASSWVMSKMSVVQETACVRSVGLRVMKRKIACMHRRPRRFVLTHSNQEEIWAILNCHRTVLMR